MKKMKKIMLLLIFVLTINFVSNVYATKVSYGYYECDYDCSLIGIEPYGSNVCHDRWKPENNYCKNKDGVLIGNQVNGALVIDYLGDKVNMATTTDLFQKGSSNFGDGIKVKYFDIDGNEDNVFVYKDDSSTNGQNRGIFLTTYYVHDFRPLIEYYELTGSYPTYVVVDYTGKFKSMVNVNPTAYAKMTYYPSDLQTTEQKYIWSDGLIDGWVAKVNDDIIKVDFMDESRSMGSKKRCRNKDYFEKMKQDGGMNCTQGDGGYATIHYYFSSDLSSNANLNKCDDLVAMIDKAKEYLDKEGNESSNYEQMINKIDSRCATYTKKTLNEASLCFEKCLNYPDEFAELDPDFAIATNRCGFGKDMVAWLVRILKIIRYIVPVIVIVLSIVEYISAIGSADDDALKKAGTRFSKRLLIMIIFFVIPSILQLIFNVFDIEGFDSSNPYCMKF